MNIEHLSPSSMNMLFRCGEQWRFRYAEGLKRPPGVALIVGSGVDKGVTVNMESKKETGRLQPLEIVTEAAYQAADAFFTMSEIAYSQEEVDKGIDKVKGEALDLTVKLSEVHYKQAAPKIFPIDVQNRWELEIDGYPFKTLMGITDIEESDVTRDTKTASRSPSADAADLSDQLLFYAYYRWITAGYLIEGCLDFLVKLKTPKFIPIYTTRKYCQSDFDRLFEKIDAAALAIEKEIFLPTNPDNWWCSEKWCGYYNICKYARR